MSDPRADRVRRLILEVVENQIREGTPPETRATLERLMSEGNSRAEAIRLIGCATSTLIWEMLAEQKPYDEPRYVATLRNLPRMPWDNEPSA